MARRLMFVIRGKLGDTLVAFAPLLAYGARHPEDGLTLLVRKNYLPLLERENGIRLIGFGSRIEMILKLARLRLRGESFDVLAVLWGFGKPLAWIARLVRAKRKIALEASLSAWFPECPERSADTAQVDPSWRVIRMLDPGIERPARLYLPGLASLRRKDGKEIGVVPFADEARRNMDTPTLLALVRALASRHPGAPIQVFLDPGEQARITEPLPEGAQFAPFATLAQLVERYTRLSAWYGTDTGLYHLAAAMGIPATVFFGPTQPLKIVMKDQPRAAWVRLAALGNDHCEEKACARPVCLHQAIAGFAGAACRAGIEDTPRSCPLRKHAPESLKNVTGRLAGA